jgi:hypothetical protein
MFSGQIAFPQLKTKNRKPKTDALLNIFLQPRNLLKLTFAFPKTYTIHGRNNIFTVS